MSFLDKANEDVSGGGKATTQSKGHFQFKATDTGAKVPKEIKDAIKDTFMVSEADEPFEAVSLEVKEDSLPDEVQFAELINHWDPNSADIEILDPLDWDKKGRYTKVIEAVRQATEGNDVRVYRVPKDATRAEYWIISVSGGRAVGVKALSIES